MITLPPEIDDGMLPRSDADVADERIVLDAVLAEVEQPGRFEAVASVLAVTMATDDTGLAFRGNAKRTAMPVGEEDDPNALRGIGQVLAGLVAMDGEVALMLRLVGPESPADHTEVAIETCDGPTAEPYKVFTAAHRRVSGRPGPVAVMASQLAAALETRWGLNAHSSPRATLAAMLHAEGVICGATELSGRPLWGERILFAPALPVSWCYRWNGVVDGATVDRGWWAAVRRRMGGGKVVTVGRYETPIEVDSAGTVVHVKGALG